MTDQNGFERLESALVRVGREFEYPATPALALRVRQQLARGQGSSMPSGRRGLRRVLVPIAVAIVLALALLLAIPEARDAVAQFLGLRGLRVFYVTPTPPPAPTAVPPTQRATPTLASLTEIRSATPTMRPSPTPTAVALCCPVSLADAEKRARFNLLVPPGEQPSLVYYQDIYGNGEQVVMVFGDPDNPRFTLYQAQQWVYGKLVDSGLGKQVNQSTVIGEAQVGGQRALWFSGAPHVVVRLDARGEPIYGTERTVNANTLVWERGNEYDGIIYRVETKLSLSDAVKFAESLQ